MPDSWNSFINTLIRMNPRLIEDTEISTLAELTNRVVENHKEERCNSVSYIS